MNIDKYVVDTNVLLVASAADESSPFSPDATPVEEAALRTKVLHWLREFESSDQCIVLDWEWHIVDEYKGPTRRNKLTDQDYGLLVVLHKISTGRHVGIALEWDEPGSARISHAPLSLIVKDHADRKMIAAVLAAGGRSNGCQLANSCDTDWYDWQPELEAADVFAEQIIGAEWCYPKWQSKQTR